MDGWITGSPDPALKPGPCVLVIWLKRSMNELRGSQLLQDVEVHEPDQEHLPDRGSLVDQRHLEAMSSV